MELLIKEAELAEETKQLTIELADDDLEEAEEAEELEELEEIDEAEEEEEETD